MKVKLMNPNKLQKRAMFYFLDFFIFGEFPQVKSNLINLTIKGNKGVNNYWHGINCKSRFTV